MAQNNYTQHNTQDQVFTRVHSRLRTCLLRHHHCQSPVTVADAVGQTQTKEVLISLPPVMDRGSSPNRCWLEKDQRSARPGDPYLH
ncbi:hypothetical protein T05_13299 [Trichinella murrelli]|uniref:Uncharacterized protein n=1 Tax=Trichinella murrelli TaxID=144512 RepID=A0A0V0TVF2_9BILA|nr:hypothetical protein T05_13299 [Trichinella murrelli]